MRQKQFEIVIIMMLVCTSLWREADGAEIAFFWYEYDQLWSGNKEFKVLFSNLNALELQGLSFCNI